MRRTPGMWLVGFVLLGCTGYGCGFCDCYGGRMVERPAIPAQTVPAMGSVPGTNSFVQPVGATTPIETPAPPRADFAPSGPVAAPNSISSSAPTPTAIPSTPNGMITPTQSPAPFSGLTR